MKLKCLYQVLVVMLCTSLQVHAQRSTPNIVLIFMDDMGYADVGVYGAKNYKTPNIDQLAKQGMRFTNFYAAQPICTVSRAALLTGCYPNRIGLKGALFPGSKVGLSTKEETIAEMLQKKNYATAIIGKWHLGDAQQFLPLQHGFDEYFGVPYSNDMWPKNDLGQPVDTGNKKYRLPALPLMEGNKVARTIDNLDEMGMLTTWYTERAVKFITDHKTGAFFLYFAHTMPHVPLAVSGKFKGKSGAGLYADVMMEVDWSVGEVMRALKTSGIDNNTLVIFTSDNGPWLVYGNHAGSAGKFREGKMTSWEGGVREACIMRWPAVIPANSINNSLSSTIDLLPTFAAITNTSLSKNKIDGVNIIELLRGNKKANPRTELLYYYNNNDLRAVRKGNWKLVFPHQYPSVAVAGKDGWIGKTRKDTTGLALYDLNKDLSEQHDVKEQHGDVVKQLSIIADKARNDLGDDLTGAKGKNRRAPGRID
jgi:arylsulfatase A-like enzyme